MPDVKKTVVIELTAAGNIGKQLESLVTQFTGLSSQIGKVAAPIDKIVKSLSGANIPSNLAPTLQAIKSLDGIKLPSINKFVEGIGKLSSLSMPNLDKFVNELNKFKGVSVPGVLQLAKGLEILSSSAVNVSQAATNIKGLTAPLTRLSNLNLANVANVANAVEKLSKISFNVGASQQLYQFADAIQKLNNIKVPDVTRLVKGMEQLRGFKDSAGKISANIDALVLSLGKFANTKLPEMGKFISGLKGIEKIDIQKVVQRITDLAAAIQVLDKSGHLKSFATLAQDLRVLSQQLNAATGPLQNIQNMLQTYGRTVDAAGQKTKGFGERLQNYLQYRVIADTVMGLENAVSQIPDILKQYDQALKDLQAISGATDVEVSLMGETIKRVAVEAKFSLTEIAEGMRTFIQAGFSAGEAIKSIQAVSDLATGTLSDMALTVDLVSTAMKVFDISAENSAHVADVFANAVNKSKLDIDKLRTAFNYVGPIAQEAGASFEETAASMMVLANSGQRASTIGTGLRRLFADLTDAPDKLVAAVEQAGMSMSDLDPRVHSLETVLKNLDIVVTDTGQAFDIFGKWGANAVMALKDMDNGFADMFTAVQKSGSAAEMASIQVQGLDVMFKNLKDRVEVAALSFGEAGLTSVLRGFVVVAGKVVDAITTFNESALGGFIIKAGMAVVAATSLLVVYGKLAVAIRAVTAAYSLNLAGGASLIAGQVHMSSGLVNLMGSLRNFTGMLTAARVAMMAFIASSSLLSGIVVSLAFPVAVLSAQFIYAVKQIDAFKKSSEEAAKSAIKFIDLQSGFKAYSDRVSDLAEGSYELKEANLELRKELLKVAEENDKLTASATKAAYAINPVTGEINKNSEALKEYNKALEDMSLESISTAYNDAVTNMKNQSSSLNQTLNTFKNFGNELVVVSSTIGSAIINSFLELDPRVGLDKLKEGFEEFKDVATRHFDSREISDRMKAGKLRYEEFYNYVTTITANGKDKLTAQEKDLVASFKLVEESTMKMLEQFMNTKGITLETPVEDLRKLAIESGVSEEKVEALITRFMQLRELDIGKKTNAGQDLVKEFSDGVGEIEGFINKYKELGGTISDNELKTVTAIERSKQALADQFSQIQANYEERKRMGVDDATNLKNKYLEEEKFMVAYRKILKQGTDDFKYHSIQKMKQASEEYQKTLSENMKFQDQKTRFAKANAQAELDFQKKVADALIAVYDTKQLKEVLQSRNATLEEQNQYELHQIALLEASGVLIAEDADKKRFQSTVKMLDAKLKASIETEEKIRASSSASDKDIANAEQERMKAAEARTKFIQEQIVKGVDAQKKANDEIEKLEKKRTQGNKEHLVNVNNAYNTLHDGIEKGRLKLADKIDDIEDKYLEKVKDINKKILEQEQETAQSIADIRASADDKIAALKNRGKSEEAVDADNRLRAAKKLEEGVALVDAAEKEKDKAKLERGRKLIEQAQSMGENFRNQFLAIKMVEGATKELVRAEEVGGKLEKLDQEKEKEEAISDAIRAKKEALEEYETRRKELLNTYTDAIIQETSRHNTTIQNLDDELSKWYEKLRVAKEIQAVTTSAPISGSEAPRREAAASGVAIAGGGVSLNPAAIAKEADDIKRSTSEAATAIQESFATAADGIKQHVSESGKAINDVSAKTVSAVQSTTESTMRAIEVNGTQMFVNLTDAQIVELRKTGAEIKVLGENAANVLSPDSMDTSGIDLVQGKIKELGVDVEDVTANTASKLSSSSEEGFQMIYKNGKALYTNLSIEQLQFEEAVGQSMKTTGEKVYSTFSPDNINTTGIDDLKDKIEGVVKITSNGATLEIKADDAKDKVQEVKDKTEEIKEVKGSVNLSIASDTGKDIPTEINDIKGNIESINTVNSTVTVAVNREEFDSFLKMIDRLLDAKITVAITASLKNKTEFEEFTKLVFKLAQTDAKPKVTVNVVGQEKVAVAKTLFDSFVNKTVNLIVNTGNSILNLGNVLRKIQEVMSFDNKVVNLTVHTRYTSSGSKPSGASQYAEGGSVFRRLANRFISAGGGQKDDVPAMLMKGEYVQPTDVVDHYGLPFMEALRKKRIRKDLIPQFNLGGLVGGLDSFVQKFANGGKVLSPVFSSMKKKLEWLLGSEKSTSIKEVNLNMNQVIKDADSKVSTSLGTAGIASLRGAFSNSISNFASGGNISGAEIEMQRKKLMAQYNQQIQSAARSGNDQAKKVLEQEKMEMAELAYELQQTLLKLKTDYETYVKERTLDYDTTVSEIKKEYSETTAENKSEHAEKLRELNEDYAADLQNLTDDMTSDTEDFNEKINEYKLKRDELTKTFEEEKNSSKLQNNALAEEANSIGHSIAKLLTDVRREPLRWSGAISYGEELNRKKDQAPNSKWVDVKYTSAKIGRYPKPSDKSVGFTYEDLLKSRDYLYDVQQKLYMPKESDPPDFGALFKMVNELKTLGYLKGKNYSDAITEVDSKKKNWDENKFETKEAAYKKELAELDSDNAKDIKEYNKRQQESNNRKQKTITTYEKSVLDENTQYDKVESERKISYDKSLADLKTDFEKDMLDKKTAYDADVKQAKEQNSKDALNIAQKAASDALAAIKSVEKTATSVASASGVSTSSVAGVSGETEKILKSSNVSGFFQKLGMSGSAIISPLEAFFRKLGLSLRRFNVGGFVSPTSDSIPGKDSIFAALTPEEYVIPAPIVRMFGKGFFDDILRMRLPGFNLGGIVGGLNDSAYSSPSQMFTHALELTINGANHGTVYGDQMTIEAILSDLYLGKMRTK